jgi:hypothetical protein
LKQREIELSDSACLSAAADPSCKVMENSNDIKMHLSELARRHAEDPLRCAIDLAILRRIEQLERLLATAQVTLPIPKPQEVER